MTMDASRIIRACCTVDRRALHLPHGVPVDEAISLNGKTWQPGEVIGVGFLGGTAIQRAKVVRWVEYWQAGCNLKYDFAAPNPPIRISFDAGRGSWSLIGTDCRTSPSGATMNFGWVTDVSDDVTDRAVIVHETLHAAGLGHEQSSPKSDLHVDLAKTEAYYMRTQGWSRAMVQSNVLDRYGADEVTATEYDRTSIMHYPFPDQLTTDGRGIPWNTDLSALDRAYLTLLYPGDVAPPPPPAPPAAGGVPLAVDGPAAVAGFPDLGGPALFSLKLVTDLTLRLRATVTGAFGRDPVVVAVPAGGQPLTLGLPRGMGTFRFARGLYSLQVYHPLPRLGGTATLRATRG